MGIAGYSARIRKAGTAVPTTGEAFTLVSGKTYKVTDRTKVPWDREATITVYDNGVPVAASNIQGYKYLTGQVIFVSTYTVTGPVTADFEYKPSVIIDWVAAADINKSANLTEITTSCDANSDLDNGLKPAVRKIVNLITSDGVLTGFFDPSDNFLALIGTGTVIIEAQPDENNSNVIIYIEAIIENEDETFDINNPNESSVTFQGQYPPEYEPA